MAIKFYVFIFLVSSVTVTIAAQYGCYPNIVTNITLHNDILTWENVEYETCNISHFIVNIENVEDRTDAYAFQVEDRSLDVTFLPPCQQYWFMITVVSTDNLSGVSRVLVGITSPSPEADFSLQYLRLSPNPTWIRLEWALADEWRRCVRLYRVLTYNEDQDIPEDRYTQSTSISLTDIMPCTSYTFAVTAIYNAEQEGPPGVIRHEVIGYETPAPSLVRISPHATSIEMTWSVEYYIKNRCPITSVNVNAAPYFAISFPIQDDPDNRLPLSITVPGLTPDTMYYFNVTVANTAGVSPGSTIYVQTLESN